MGKVGAEVCAAGKWGSGGSWSGPPRWHLQGRFERWADHLAEGVDVSEEASFAAGGAAVATEGPISEGAVSGGGVVGGG